MVIDSGATEPQPQSAPVTTNILIRPALRRRNLLRFSNVVLVLPPMLTEQRTNDKENRSN